MPNRPSLPCLDGRRRGRLHPSAAIFSVLLLVPVALLGWEASRSDNLVQNSSFEKGGAQTAQAWTTNIWSGEPVFRIDPVAGRTGNRAVVISSEEGGDGSWSFPLKVKPNRDYRVTAWIKTEDVGGGGLGALINLHELQFEGKSDALKGDNDWTRITTEFNSGPRDRLTLNCLFGGWGRATGTAWFDDIEVVQVSKEPEVPQMSEAEAGEFFETKVLPVFHLLNLNK